MRHFHSTVAVLVGATALACGSAQVSEENIRKSDRQYEAAYVAWNENGDNLAAIRHLTIAVEANPENDDAQYLLGTIRLGRGEYDEALTHLLAAVTHRKDDAAKRVEALNSLGVLYIHTKRYDEAVTALKEASGEVLNRAPWLAFGNLGWAYTEQGQYDLAEEALKRALFDQPQFCVGLYRLGNVCYLTSRYEEARDYLEQAIGITEGGCDRLQEAHHLLGMTLLRLDAVDDAIAAFDTCVNIAPKTPMGMDCAAVRRDL